MNDEADDHSAGSHAGTGPGQPTAGGPPSPAGASPGPGGDQPGPPGFYPDPWDPRRRRFWTGQSWTAWTADPAADQPDPGPSAPPPAPPIPASVATYPPPPASPAGAPPPSAGPPPPSGARPAGQPPAPAPPHRPSPAVTVAVVVAAGLAVVLLAALLVHARSTSTSTSAAGRSPSALQPPGSSVPTDPAASALTSLIVRQSDVPSSMTVELLPGGNQTGDQPTLDLCNGSFPSEALRSARLQVVAVDNQNNVVLSTEAVLYQNAAGAAQALSELQKVAAACPSTPVASPVGDPTVTTKFNPPPDASWPQTASVTRLAYDFVTTDDTGQSAHYMAVYLRRGRALLGVYFSQPDQAQPSVAGQTTIPGIVNVFAQRLASLPANVVGG